MRHPRVSLFLVRCSRLSGWAALLLGGCALPARRPATSLNPFGGAGTSYEVITPALRAAGRPASFGPYQASEVRRGWNTVSRHPGPAGRPSFNPRTLSTTQGMATENSKVSFRFADDQGHEAAVYAGSQTITQSVPSQPMPLGPAQLTQRSITVFSALIAGPQLDTIATTTAWHLLLNPPDPRQRPAAATPNLVGLVSNERQVQLRIGLVPALAAYPGWATGPQGIEVLHQQQLIGYVDLATTHPTVWLRDDLAPGLRFLTAATISTLLVHYDNLPNH